MFFSVNDKQIKQLSTELKENLGHSDLIKLLEAVGLSEQEETLIIKRYGQERLSVEEICERMAVSESTYKRVRRAALNKMVNYLIYNNVEK